jgi:hypothetical protein
VQSFLTRSFKIYLPAEPTSVAVHVLSQLISSIIKSTSHPYKVIPAPLFEFILAHWQVRRIFRIFNCSL